MRSRWFFLIFCSVLTCIALACLTGCASGRISGATAQPTPSPSPTVSPTPSPFPSATPTPTTSPSPTPTPIPVGATSRFIFGISVFESSFGYEAGQISNGTVTPIADFNDAGLGQNIVPQLIADPRGRFLYALNVGASSFGITLGPPGIAEMQINSQTGALTRVPGSPLVFTTPTPTPHDGMLAIDLSGRFLYQPSAGVFDIYSIDQSSGLLTKTSSSVVPSLGLFMAISPDGRFLFNAGNQLLEALSIGSNGDLTLAQPPILTGGSAMGFDGQLTVTSDSKFLFIMNQSSMSIFNISLTGTLTPVIGSPFATDAGAAGFSIAPDGRHLYVAFQSASGNSVKGFTFDPTANTVTPIPGASITDNALTVTIDVSGRFAYVTEAGELVTYSIDPVTGALTRFSQAAKPISEGQQSMVVVP